MHPCNNLPGYHPRSGDRLGRKTLGGSLFAAHKRILELNLCCICNNGGGLLRWAIASVRTHQIFVTLVHTHS